MTFYRRSTAADLVYAPIVVTEENLVLRVAVARVAKRSRPGGYWGRFIKVTEGDVQKMPDPAVIAPQRNQNVSRIFRNAELHGEGTTETAAPSRSIAFSPASTGDTDPHVSKDSPVWAVLDLHEANTSASKASSHEPEVEAREYSVERFSKKLACSTALSISSSQGSGFSSMP